MGLLRTTATAVGVAALAAAATAVCVSPAQAYGPTPGNLGCRLYFNDAGTGSSPTNWADSFGLTQTPATPSPGQTVTVTFTAAAGPNNGPVAINPGDVPIVVEAALGGSQSGPVTLQQTNYPAGPIPGNTPTGPITATGTYVAGATGAATLTVNRVILNNPIAKTYCSAAGDRDHKAAPVPTSIVESFTVFGGTVSVTSVTGQTVTGAARAGNVINYAVTGLAPSTALTATLRAADGTGTAEGSGTGTTDAAGAGTGTLTVPSGATTGARTVAVSDGTNTVSVPITILGSPGIAITPSGGGSGTVVTVTGTNWNPGSTVTIGGYKALTGAPPPPATSDPATTATAGATGGINATFTVTDSTTAYVGAQSGALFAISAWTGSADSCTAKTGSATTGNCTLSYNLSETVTAGNLSMARATGTGNIPFSGVTVGGSVQTATGDLSTVTVTDHRGSTFGWSLVGTVTDFTGTPGGTIAKSNLSWTPACVDTAGATNAVTAVAGTPGTVDAATLCSAPTSATGTGGSFDASAGLTLSVPANQLAGTYAATLTLTLS
ncbi:hypothetical protein ABZU92_12400 [Micromonospora arida]|uniref:hypothetical protein n=1 Tax=Micromonospora arida TaxID=2203715 RepID=UPI0033B2EF73